MKRILTTISIFSIMLMISISANAQSESQDRSDYIIVVSNSKDKAANESVLNDMKKEYADAGMYHDSESGQYYVYIERYYVKKGADYAVWWYKKNRPNLPKVWAKAVPPGSNS